MLNVQEGQTYICVKSDRPWWTVGKEYKVVLNANNKPLLLDDEDDGWPSDAYEMYATFKLKEETIMTILKRYKCIKSNDEKRFAVGEIYPLYEGKINYIVANNGTKWYEDHFPLIEKEHGVLLKLMDEQEKSAKCTYTPFEVNKVIIKAYQIYDNDSQRLAYIKGYFAE